MFTPKGKQKVVKKGWGNEIWYANNENYCGKLLNIRKDKKTAEHYHVKKHETFLIGKGRVLLLTIENGRHKLTILFPGDSYEIPQEMIHQLIGLDDINQVIEFSTHHEDKDSIFITSGDEYTK